jgi:hypothetical protein
VPPPLPWKRPRRELLLLLLVAVAALSPVYVISTQDTSRLCLTRSLVQLRLSADDCLDTPMAWDQAVYKGHLYSDKAPGMSALEIPAAEAVHLPLPTAWPWESRSLWVVRVFSSGLAFLVCAFLVGRVAEGIAPGYGGWTLVAFALGTLVAPFAVANFDHVPTAAFGFGAFVLAWRRRPLLSGLAAGAALLLEYEATLLVVVIGGYVAAQRGWALVHYIRGVLPGAGLLWTYDWMAFGAPWHPSYRYVSTRYASDQRSGFFGIGTPNLHAVYEVFVGNEGLLIISPVVAAGVAGLVLLGPKYKAEAIVCATVAAAFVYVNCGYFLPYGGRSPGPRFLIPALPFLALGLAQAFARIPRATAALATLSVIAMTTLTLTWALSPQYRETVWGELARVPMQLGSSHLAKNLAANIVTALGPGRLYGALLVAICAAAAVITAHKSSREAHPPAR